MKIIVTHTAPDLDAATSVWLIRRFLPNWHDARVEFVPAGERYKHQELGIRNKESGSPIEKIGIDEVIHVDTGMGPLDHHQTDDQNTCAASLTWIYVKKFQIPNSNSAMQNQINSITQGTKPDKHKIREQAVDRMVKIVVDIDHFREVYWDNPTADYHEFSLFGIMEGIKLQKPDDDGACIALSMECLDALMHHFENKIWAEEEIAQNGIAFQTKWGKGIGFETINDTVVKLAQKMGYAVVVRKDPRKGYVRVKARPSLKSQISNLKSQEKHEDIDLTLVYEQLKKMDPEATWFLHVSKKMLLNGSVKNPKMRPTRLSLDDIIHVIKKHNQLIIQSSNQQISK